MSENDPDWRAYRLAPAALETTTCDCCGDPTQTVSSDLFLGDDLASLYWVTWTPGKPDHRAAFRLVFGPWGDGADPSGRALALADYFIDEERGGSFWVRDDATALIRKDSAVRAALSRADIVGVLFGMTFFAILDAIFMKDPRLDEIRRW